MSCGRAKRSFARAEAAGTGEAVRRFAEFDYATLDSWSHERRVVAKAEALPPSTDGWLGREGQPEVHRGIARSREASGALLDEPVRLERPAAVPQQVCDGAGQPPQGRAGGCRDAAGRAYPGTLRNRLLKIGARVRVSSRRIHVALSTACPDRQAFALTWRSLSHRRRRNPVSDLLRRTSGHAGTGCSLPLNRTRGRIRWKSAAGKPNRAPSHVLAVCARLPSSS